MTVARTPRKISWEMQFLGGLNLRSLFILAITIPVAGTIAFTPLIPGPIWLRIALGLTVAVLGLVFTFAKFSGRTFEQWLLDVVAWRTGGRQWVWRRGRAPTDAQVVLDAAPWNIPFRGPPTVPFQPSAEPVGPVPARTEGVATPRNAVVG